MRVRLYSLGCRLNEAETEQWAAQLQGHGVVLAGPAELAGLVVINTCAVTHEAERKSRNLLRRAQRANPSARLVVSGCYATLRPEAVAAASRVDLLVPNRDKDRLVQTALKQLELPILGAPENLGPAQSLLDRGRQRAFVKVQDGCRHHCTYCIVRTIRGPERNRPIEAIRAEIATLAAAGVREVVLTGVHLGGYRCPTGGDLLELLRVLLGETPIERLRIGALEPWDIPDGLWGLFADQRLMPHLHLPMQSGSDRILRRMARRATTGGFARLVETGRAIVSDLVITTDIIVGFPGERDEDWAATREFAASTGFGDLHVFAYSPRSGTPAADWPDQVPDAVKRVRCQELRELASSLRLTAMGRLIGRQVPVLVEGRGPASTPNHWSGYTPSYLPVRVPRSDGPTPVGQIVNVALADITADGAALLGAATGALTIQGESL